MKIIYVNCGLRNELESDLRGDEHYLNTLAFGWLTHHRVNCSSMVKDQRCEARFHAGVYTFPPVHVCD